MDKTIIIKKLKTKYIMACVLNSGWSLDCRDNSGGIQKVYIANLSEDTTYAYNTEGAITGITSGATYYTFEQTQETAGFDQAGQHNVQNGTNFWEQSVSLSLHKYQASVRDLLYTLAQTETTVIVLDQNGKYFLVGEQNGAYLTESNPASGTAYGDMNGATFTLLAKEPSPAREITAAAFATLTVV